MWAALGDEERVRFTRHRVKQGETLGAVAAHYQMTASALREINHLRGNTVRAGDELLIPSPMGALGANARNTERRDLQRESAAAGQEPRTYVVASGDTLWSIAKRHGTDVRSLAAWNAMAPGDVLRVGRELIVGIGGESPQGGYRPTTAQVAAPAQAAAAVAPPTQAAAISTPTPSPLRAPSTTGTARSLRPSAWQAPWTASCPAPNPICAA